MNHLSPQFVAELERVCKGARWADQEIDGVLINDNEEVVMSWSFSKTGTKEEVQKFLDEEAPKAIAHVQGVERTMADNALGLLRASVEANLAPDKYDITLSAAGHAVFGTIEDEHGARNDQVVHSLSVSCNYVGK